MDGARCPSCGTWMAAESLRCICGFRPRAEASRAIAAGLTACVAGGALWFLFWTPGGALCVWPLGVFALTCALYGIRCGLFALKGNSLDKALGTVFWT